MTAALQSALIALQERRLRAPQTGLIGLLPPMESMESLFITMLWLGGAANALNRYRHVFLTGHVRSALGASYRADDLVLARLYGFPDGSSFVRVARRDRSAMESGRFRPALAGLPGQQIRARVPPLNHLEF